MNEQTLYASKCIMKFHFDGAERFTDKSVFRLIIIGQSSICVTDDLNIFSVFIQMMLCKVILFFT